LAWIIQFVALFATILLLGGVASAGISAETRRRLLLSSALSVAVVSATLPLSGHAASAKSFRAVALIADGLHVLGAGAWLGTLAVMTFTVLARRRDNDDEAAAQERQALVHAFSPVAMTCVAVVALSGLFAAAIHIRTVPAILGSAYGRMVLLKLAAVAVVLLLGLVNWKRNTALMLDDKGRRLNAGAMRELVATVAVLLVTSALVVTAPPT
jgi:putative copper export protein